MTATPDAFQVIAHPAPAYENLLLQNPIEFKNCSPQLT